MIHLLGNSRLGNRRLSKQCLVTNEGGGSLLFELAQGVGEIGSYKLTQKSGVYSVRAINKHH